MNGTIAAQSLWLNKMCASVSSPYLENLHLSFKTWHSGISKAFAALAHFRAIDTTLSRSQFSRLSNVVFIYRVKIALPKEPDTFGCLTGSYSNTPAIGASTSPEFLPGDALPSHAYTINKYGTPQLSQSYLEEFLRRRADGVLHQLHRRGILTNKISVHLHRNHGAYQR